MNRLYWLPLQARLKDLDMIPPLDVHWIWHTHMLSPTNYRSDCEFIVGSVVDHKLLSPEQVHDRYESSVKVWQEFCHPEPYDFRECSQKYIPYKSKSSYDIASAIHRQRNFNYQVSLPHYMSRTFLAESVERYKKILFLKQMYPSEPLTPCYDFDLVWHTHQVHPHTYNDDSVRTLGRILKHDDSTNNRSPGSKLMRQEAVTKEMWQKHFPTYPFCRPGSMYRGHMAPGLLSFGVEDLPNIICGGIQISSVTLNDIPVQREQLNLKFAYGSTKVATFNVDLSTKGVTRNLVWQLTENAKFTFDKRNPKDLLVELDLFNKGFLRRKEEHVRLIGRTPLELLLLSLDSRKPEPNVTHVTLKNILGVGKIEASINLTTSLSQIGDFKLSVGDFVSRNLLPDTSFFDICHIGALNKCKVIAGQKVYVGTHSLTDARGLKYTVEVVHSVELLLSMVLVYGNDKQLLSVAHLIGQECLPSRDQLDQNLQCLPNLSSSDERAFVVMNKDGDFAVIKAKWEGFRKRIDPTDDACGTRGDPGKLQVEASYLLKNVVQKFELPGRKGYVLGDAGVRLSGKKIQCNSTFMAENVACVFTVATLFVLCNPDKVLVPWRWWYDTIGHKCRKWPLTLACGYGIGDVPTNRSLGRLNDSGSCCACYGCSNCHAECD